VAILATDGITKRPVVVEDPMATDRDRRHPVGVLALAWDSRAFDGATRLRFPHAVRRDLRTRDWEAELAVSSRAQR